MGIKQQAKSTTNQVNAFIGLAVMACKVFGYEIPADVVAAIYTAAMFIMRQVTKGSVADN